MEIRPATVHDIPAIRHIASLTWPIAYAEILSPGQLSYMLNNMYDHATLQSQMQEQGHQFFICVKNSQTIGFSGVSKYDHHPTPGKIPANAWKLHKLYVLPDAHRSGAGNTLLDRSFAFIAANGGNFVVLNVNRQNAAYQFYLKKGFKVLEELDLDIGAGFFMRDYIMGKVVGR